MDSAPHSWAKSPACDEMLHFWDMKYQGIYNTTILYLSKILKNTLGLFPIEFMSRVGIDFTVALMVWVFMALSLQGLCMCIFVLTARIYQERNYFLVLLKMSVSHVSCLLLLNFEWVVHGGGNHNWTSLKCIRESPKLLFVVLLTCICLWSGVPSEGSFASQVAACSMQCSAKLSAAPRAPGCPSVIAMCGNMCLSVSTWN